MALAIFSQAALDAAISRASTDIPPGHTHAIVATVDQTGAQFAVVFGSSDGNFKAVAAFEHSWDGNDSVGAKLIESW